MVGCFTNSIIYIAMYSFNCMIASIASSESLYGTQATKLYLGSPSKFIGIRCAAEKRSFMLDIGGFMSLNMGKHSSNLFSSSRLRTFVEMVGDGCMLRLNLPLKIVTSSPIL